MLTEFGREIRKMRIDRGEILKNMADKLGITSSYLSAIECGKRSIPDWIIDRLAQIYELSEYEKNILQKAMQRSLKDISLDVAGVSDIKMDLALRFARTFKDIDDNTALKIRKLLKEGQEQ